MLMLTLAACGGGTSGDTTAPADDGTETTTTPTTVATTADSGNEVSSLADMPQECIDAFRTFLQEIEPIVEGRDFNAMTQADMEALSTELEEATAPLEDEVADCPELDMEAEDSIAEMREFAEAEAPGTVAYFVWLEEFINSLGGEDGLGGGAAVSGDCETDIAAMQAMVDAGGTMSDLTVGELAAAGQLITAISTECAAERLQEFMEDPAVEAWMSG
jgi:hypothetical protein